MSDDLERVRQWMMARLDDELSAEDGARLDRLLAEDANLREEWERLRALKEVTRTMRYPQPPPETWEHYWVSVYNKLERGVGWILLSLGATALIGYALWQSLGSLWADPGTPWLVKAGIYAALFGGAILLVSVLREKLFTRRGERYDEVQR